MKLKFEEAQKRIVYWFIVCSLTVTSVDQMKVIVQKKFKPTVSRHAYSTNGAAHITCKAVKVH